MNPRRFISPTEGTYPTAQDAGCDMAINAWRQVLQQSTREEAGAFLLGMISGASGVLIASFGHETARGLLMKLADDCAPIAADVAAVQALRALNKAKGI